MQNVHFYGCFIRLLYLKQHSLNLYHSITCLCIKLPVTDSEQGQNVRWRWPLVRPYIRARGKDANAQEPAKPIHIDFSGQCPLCGHIYACKVATMHTVYSHNHACNGACNRVCSILGSGPPCYYAPSLISAIL